jgi:uncharacterized protein (DUF849 family)
MTDRLCVTLRNGTVLDSGQIRYPSGHARLPLTQQQLQDKFMDCVASGLADGHAHGNAASTAQQAGLDPHRARQLYQALDRLPDVANIRTLFTP